MSFPNPTRRTFLAGTGALGLSGLFGTTAMAAIDPNSFKDRVFHATHFGPLEAIVRDGKIVAVQPVLEIDARPTEMLTEGVVDRVYSKTRIKYPMVRKSYLEGWESGDVKPELRGKEEFVRVDWDTALNLAAKALLDTIDNVGNEGIFNTYSGWGNAGCFRPHAMKGRLLNLIGGATTTIGDWSAGCSLVTLPHVIGDIEVYSAQTAWEVIRDETEVFVFVGCDPIKNCRAEYRVADHQMTAHWEEIRDNGTKFVSINPQRTASDELLDAEWVKIVPNTDVALFLAMAYHVLEKGLEDRAYMEKYTVGADKWIAYVKGEDDGVAKTPAWAAKITGISEEKIKEMAELFASSKTEIAGAWSLQRADHGEMTHWVIINFAALTGKIGVPGEGVGFSWHYGNGGMPQGGNATPSALGEGRNPVKTVCPASRLYEMLENPGQSFKYNGIEYTYPKIETIVNGGGNFIGHNQDTNRVLSALQNVKTVMSADVWWTAAVRWADIVFPASTTLERNDITSGGTYSNDKVYAMKQVVDPIGESLSDYEIYEGLADKLGVWAQFTDSLDYMDHIKGAYAKTTAAKTVSFEEFWEKGYVLMDTPEEARRWTRHGAFYEDPEANPLHTATGKIEMFCEGIAAMEIEDCPGMPSWMEPGEYLHNGDADDLHMVTPHPWFRVHSQMDDSESLQKLYKVQGREPVRMNTQDAEKRGIKDGDLVELYNARGTIIAGAVVSDDIMPGVISIYEGAWPQIDSKGRCNSGSVNFLNSTDRSSGLTHATTINTCLTKARKCEDPDGPNRAYEPPAIIEGHAMAAVDEDKMGLDRAYGIADRLMADMTPEEKLFYETCTVCHSPRDPGHYTKLQWKATLPAMFERAGVEEAEMKAIEAFLLERAADAH